MTRPREQRGTIGHHSTPFGRSVSGIPLEVFLPGVDPSDKDPLATFEAREPIELLIVAAQHGDEPETTCLLSHSLRRVEPKDLRAAAVLTLNPDGLMRSTRSNLRGVDLNRNFPASNWSNASVAYRWSSKDPRDVALSSGTAAGSEPETVALLRLIDALRPKTIISLHAPLACVDDPASSELAQKLAEKTGLELVTDIGYPTPGSFGTFATERSLHVITFELPHLSLEELRLQFEEIFEQLLRGDFR